MSWFSKLFSDVADNVKKEWNMSDTNQTEQSANTIQSTGTVVAPTPVTTTTPVEVPASTGSTPPTPAPATSSTTQPVSTTVTPAVSTVGSPNMLSEVSKKLEAAVSDLEAFVTMKESIIASIFEAEYAKIKAAAEAQWHQEFTAKSTIVSNLNNDLNVAKTWLVTKIEAITKRL